VFDNSRKERAGGTGRSLTNKMPSSWTESNRLHASNQRENAAKDALADYRDFQIEEIMMDEIIEEVYEGLDPYAGLYEPSERYLDGEHSGRYYHRKSR
jgi:hypothetical protein